MSLLFIPLGLAGPGLGAVVVAAARLRRCRRILPKRDEGEKFRRRGRDRGKKEGGTCPPASLAARRAG